MLHHGAPAADQGGQAHGRRLLLDDVRRGAGRGAVLELGVSGLRPTSNIR